ncbi:beta-N-acetylhexosaminidase [Clostridium perfringens]|uniref:beta-N-acetylhexosaminidase n=1 Tax=Clostridium perfringens TaxID=1502 RepID=UPI0022472062|nr:beta-N-acetylhexosaminidase [Clostridium perfringens]MCX0355266.1 beta-N-acetylhexosaminidase [Clostridium perfringens]
MKKFLFLILLIIILSLAYSFIFNTKVIQNTLNNSTKSQSKEEDINSDKTIDNSINSKSSSKQPSKDLIQEKIDNMSLDEKIGQLVISGVESTSIDTTIQDFIQKKYIGGVILFSRNVSTAQQVLNLTNSIKDTNKSNKIPLFISVDEEGGLVSRLPKEFIKLPKNSYIGEIDNPKFSYDIGKSIGKELSSLGYNMDFAPVMDINSNPKNPVIGARSFGNNEKIVSELGIETMKGLQSENIIPVIKHFPGHGDTSVDSHIGLPIVNNDLNRLKNFELVPFKSAINNGADVVMVSHILLSKLDNQYPASLSSKIITDLLRNQLNFMGVIITDDMTMGAISKNYGIGDAAVKSLLAGSDIILVCHEYDNVNKVLDSIKLAVKNNVISEQRINQSLYRILSLKEKYKLNNNPINNLNINDVNTYIKNILNKFTK